MSTQREPRHSQNFIRNAELVRELLELTNIGPQDLVIEIGPGKGIMTHELVDKAGRVIGVEQDRDLANRLSEHNFPNLQLVVDDFLEWKLPKQEYKVFSNIPFNYTADIVHKLTRSNNSPSDMYLIMQKAAAYRFAGEPYNKNSLVSTLLSIDYSVQVLRAISPRAFIPKPNVKIVFVHFKKHIERLIPNELKSLLRDFIVYGYTQWALTVLDAYKKVFSSRQRQIISKSLDLKGLKPSQLSIEQWQELFNVFCNYTSEEKKRIIQGSEGRLGIQQQNLRKSYRTRDHN